MISEMQLPKKEVRNESLRMNKQTGLSQVHQLLQETQNYVTSFTNMLHFVEIILNTNQQCQMQSNVTQQCPKLSKT